MLTPVAFASASDPLGQPHLTPPHPTKVSPFTAHANKKTAAVVTKSAHADRVAAARAHHDQQTKVTWPHQGTASLRIPAKGAASATPGSLPVTVSAPAKGKRGAAVTVQVLDQKTATQLGVKGVVLKVTGRERGGRTRLGIDYAAFASAYGGDWAGRLHLTRLPDCALRTPTAARCHKRGALPDVNNRAADSISAPLTLPPGGQPMLLALAADTKSGAGDYKATPLSASSTWAAGGSSGSFTWSYPFRTPPAAAGPQPDLSISYDSGSIDGRTANTNNQGSQIGEGFDLTSSYVERKYGSCDDDGQDGKYDLCWKFDNASLVLNGKATELVKDDTSGTWRLKDDDASTVIHSTGADNDDDNGEYWTVVTGDGTKYVFGLNKLEGAGTSDRTQSVWTVPVFGDDEGEPGYADGTSFPDRAKTQAWRWNLDYVEDTHGNAMSYWYTAEKNNYDKLGDDNTGTGYVRGGYLKEIRYGQRAGTLFSASPAASDKVVFDYAERCLASGTGCDALTKDTRDNWPDVPFDAVCKDGEKCTGNVGPTFFTRKRLTTVTTYAWNAKASTPSFDPVDAWSLKQLYLDPGDTGDSTDQSLWLDEIRHTGKHVVPWVPGPGWARAMGIGRGAVEFKEFATRVLPNFVKGGATTGIGATKSGRVFRLVSGNKKADAELLGIVNDTLQKKGILKGASKSGYASDVEQKMAAIMIRDDIDEAELIINHPNGPCSDVKLGCDAVLPALLGDKKQLTVYWPNGKGGFNREIYGGGK
ncbi:DddA-like double-stranded DNA deaminase toxin [Streptomyces sp. HGB0020]|uniref:DddA-like double-stranded DNA deaminase toxin n=1 Tax=Streptomyces sp. HGB0020 TaxID=1078086 RepID=UPI000998B1C9